jgi:hypothetical protein
MLPPLQHRSPHLALPSSKAAIQIVRSPFVDSKGLASALVTPNLRVQIAERQIEVTPWPRVKAEQVVPSLEDVRRWQAGYHSDKKREESLPWRSRKPRHLRTPQGLALRKLKAGVSLDIHCPDTVLSEVQSPALLSPRQEPTSLRLFPSATDRYFPVSPRNLPPLSNPLENPGIARLAMGAETAFATSWRKQEPLKNCVFSPTLHPEFSPQPADHHRRKDAESLYREALTRVQNMMGGRRN